jgi:hypothetical protein
MAASQGSFHGLFMEGDKPELNCPLATITIGQGYGMAR